MRSHLYMTIPAFVAAGCMVETIDLRGEQPADLPSPCTAGERRDPSSGECAACITMPEAPGDCLCRGVTYSPAAFPYCDTSDAYYECLACSGSIAACTDFTAAASADAMGVTANPERLTLCCDTLLTTGAKPCCPCQSVLHFEIDDVESGNWRVSCLPTPECVGVRCPVGDECAAWQTCVMGTCTPACHPILETCSVDSGCVCQSVAP